MNGLIETLLSAEAERKLFAARAGWISAGDVRQRAGQIAARIKDTPGDAYVHTVSAAHFSAALLGAAACGKGVVLLAHTLPAYLAEIGCQPRLLIDDAFFGALNGAGADVSGARADPNLIIYTSGSTAAPKPVAKPLRFLEIESRVLEGLWGKDVGHVRATVSHQHIYGCLFRVVWPLMSGRTSDDEAATYWEELDGKLGGATLVSSPAHLMRLTPAAECADKPPAMVFSSGRLLPPDAAQECVRAFGKPVVEVLGSTETGGIAWRRQFTAEEPWTPFPDVRVTASADGALSVQSDHLGSEAAQETGDGVDLRGDGRFALKPRGDRIAKIDGKRVSLTRVEQALLALPEVSAAASLSLPDRKDALAAIVVLSDAGKKLLGEHGAFRLSRHLRKTLATATEPAERPKHWRFVDDIPTTSEGKRVLHELRALFDPSDPLAPLKLDIRSKTDSEAELVFTLPPELIFFDGHFAERAILPGVAQSHIAVVLAERLWGQRPVDSNLGKLKFRRVLVPHDEVILKLRRDAAIGRIAFSFINKGETVSQGEIGGFKP